MGACTEVKLQCKARLHLGKRVQGGEPCVFDGSGFRHGIDMEEGQRVHVRIGCADCILCLLILNWYHAHRRGEGNGVLKWEV
jgi:hypothetical protein